MAWTDMCKVHFYTTVATKKAQGCPVKKKLLDEMAKETGIPYKTLDRWYYEERSKRKKTSKLRYGIQVLDLTRNLREIKKSNRG